MTFPPISIIILTYNGRKYIERLLQSIAKQEYPAENLEVIVADNASSDGTCDFVAENFPSVRLIRNEKNYGFALGNNKAVEQATHDTLVLLNQDTICHRSWLAELAKEIAHDERCGACSVNLKNVDLAKITPEAEMKDESFSFCDLSIFGYGIFRESEAESLATTKLISGCSFIIRKKVIEDIGYLFDPDMGMYCEDTDLSLRLRNYGYKLCVSRKAILYHDKKVSRGFDLNQLRMAIGAIKNRPIPFYKNMNLLEFIAYLPLMLLGSPFKIRELSLPISRQILWAIPFGFLSIASIILSVFKLHNYSQSKNEIIKKRRDSYFGMMKYIIGNNQ